MVLSSAPSEHKERFDEDTSSSCDCGAGEHGTVDSPGESRVASALGTRRETGSGVAADLANDGSVRTRALGSASRDPSAQGKAGIGRRSTFVANVLLTPVN